MKRWFLASALALAAHPSLAEAPKPKVEATEASRWAQSPTNADFARVLPPETVKAPVSGRALMRCRAQGDGTLADCAIIADSASGAGYGKALLTLAGQYRLKPEALAALSPDHMVIVAYSHLPSDNAPGWLRKPTADDLVGVWPKAALRQGLGGKATINCLVGLQGALLDCVPTSESPAGQNFGAAAVALAPQLLFRPATLNGQNVLSQVSIPINFVSQGGGWGGREGGGGSDLGHRVTQPAMAWLEAPSYAQVIAAYPKKAKAEGVVGRATLNCEFMSTGRLQHCATVAEEPRGQGFAEAAKALSKLFRAPGKTADGASLAGVDVQLPFAFDRSMQTEKVPAVGKPLWASLPTLEDTRAAFSAVAKTVEGTVRVMLTCTVQEGGSVDGCTVAREDPAGQGVGEAALSLAPHFRMTTWTMEGLPTVGATINIPLRYEGGPSAAAPSKP